MKPPSVSHRLLLSLMLAMACGGNGCRRGGRGGVPLGAASSSAVEALDFFAPEPVGRGFTRSPWITHVNTCDLDRDGRTDILACEGLTNEVVWLRQAEPGRFEETTVGAELRGPVHVEPADLDGDGDTDLLVASMGQVMPNNDRIGAVIVLENDGRQRFTPRFVLENVARVTDVRAADFNGDGRLDLAVAQFGYDQGEVRWLEATGPWTFRSHALLNLAGAVNACVADFDGNGTSDLAVLVSQQWEEIHLFANDGRGGFTAKKIYGSTNPDFGSSGMSVCDLNGDGRADLLFTAGDGFDYATPGPRPWHGVHWLENRGGAKFRAHRIGDLPGAYSPIGVDLDRDGDMDVVATSAFAKWENARAVSLMYFANDGRERFTPHVLARTPTHLVTAAVADLDGDGRPALVTGGFHVFPPHDHQSRLQVWRRRAE